MKKLSLVYFSATGMDISSLSGAAEMLQQEGLELDITARTALQLFDKARIEDFVAQALKADAVILTLHGGKRSFPACKALEDAFAALGPDDRRPWLHIQPTNGDDDSLDAAEQLNPNFMQEQYLKASQYIRCGGRHNYYQLLKHIHNQVLGGELDCLEPVKPPFEGIYHPDFAEPLSLEEYLKLKHDPFKLTVGVWFSQNYWLNNNLLWMDSLIRSIEAQGANALAVFHLRYKSVDLGNRGADYALEHFFLNDDGSPRIDALLNPQPFSMNLNTPEYKDLLPKLNVPVLQAIVCYSGRQLWAASLQGLPIMNVSMTAAQPEFDGNLITVPFAFKEEKKIDPVTKALLVTYEADTERTDKLVRLGLNWGRLNHTPPAERRVAIIFHHYPPRNDRIGCAAGLDSFASVSNLLKALKNQGYKVDKTFEQPNELSQEMLSRLTSDRRWLSPDQMAARAEANAAADRYIPWHNELPEKNRAKQIEDWGEVPGELFVHEGKMLFAGLKNGNIFITIQPTRGRLENLQSLYHNMDMSPPHQYLAQYRWIRDVLKAHAVIHVGKHGSLEWLPGKGLGLSNECWPDLSIMELPNIYPYIINDPGEGTQAKRRSYACIIDHLTPAFTNADLYDDLAKVEQLVSDYSLAEQEDPAKLPHLQDLIWQAVLEANLHQDLGLSEQEAKADFPEFLEKLHSYMHELSDTMIADGLHILGQAPEGERLTEYAVQLTRLANGDVPSLRESLAEALGYDYDELLAKRGSRQSAWGNRSGANIIEEIHRQALALVTALAEEYFEPSAADYLPEKILGLKSASASAALRYIASSLVPNIRLCRQEIDFSLKALAGAFVEPGPSGAPSRGQADILPTGRNFYSVDPNKIPSPAAWKTGVALGEALIERALKETGRYPQNIGIILFGSATMRTRGDDLAEILYLMGLKPVWAKGGAVEGLEVMSLKELGRPRLDVTARISGFFRDAFPNLVERLDEAVEIAASLKEPPESNFIRRNVYKDMEEYRLQGLSEQEAWRQASFRVFGCPPGAYGAGVKELVESKQWESQADLGEIYIRYTGHAYGRNSYGLTQPEALRKNLARMELTVKNEDSREYDMMSCTDYYNYYGGLIVAAKTVRGTLPLAIVGDSSDPRRIKMRSTFEEAKHILRSRLVNPKWIAGLKRHGYKGAGDISHMMDVMLGWDATAEVMDDWMYETVAKSYALDKQMQQWMKEVNPYALQNILDKLLEAISRGLWEADDDMQRQLKEAYLEMEGEVEEWSDRERAVAS